MKPLVSFFPKISFIFSALIASSGCASKQDEKVAVADVYFSKNLLISDYLESSDPLSSNLAGELKQQLAATWSFSIALASPKAAGELDVNSCEAFFQAEESRLEPVKAFEYAAYQAAGASCKAIKAALQLQPAKASYVANLSFNKQTLSQFPSQFAMVISSAERQRLSENSNIKFWSDIESLKSVSKQGVDTYEVAVKGGTHSLKILARGDANGDGIEDLLVRDDQSVTEGSYSASHLWLLTKLDDSEPIQLLKAY